MSKRADRRIDDAGLSLLEVIVALTLIGIIATAAATFFISGMSANKKLQQDQLAASVAATGLDAARAVSPRPPTDGDVSGLLKGRNQGDVAAAFGAADPEDIADLITTDVWDPVGAPGTEDDWVPLTKQVRIANTTYDVTTLIGGCYRLKSASVNSQDCVVSGWNADDYSLIYRVRVVVNWNGKTCVTESCVYRATALIDPTRDYLWNTNLKPYAFDDDMEIDAGDQFTVAPKFTAVLGNDEVVYQDGENPVRLTSDPNYGVAAISYPGVTYQPREPDVSGRDEFTYRLVDAQGRQSDDAVVRVQILPNPQDDNGGAVAAGDQLVIDVVDNDFGKNNVDGLDKEILLTLDPDLDQESDTSGDPANEIPPNDLLIAQRQADRQAVQNLGLSVNGNNEVVFDAPSDAVFGETITFYYWLLDVDNSIPDGDRFYSNHAAKVTVLIGECINIDDHEIEIMADQLDDAVDLKINELNDNKAGCQIKILDTEYPYQKTGEIKVGGSNYNAANNNQSNNIAYEFQQDRPTLFYITYEMWSADGSFSTHEERKLTIKVIPVANDDEYVVGPNQEFRPANAPTNRKLRDNDFPANGAQVKIIIEDPLPSGCGNFVPSRGAGGELSNDGLVYRSPNSTRTCTFSYRLVPSDSGLEAEGIRSRPAEVTFNIGNSNIHNTINNVYAVYAQTPNIGNSAIETVTQIRDRNANTKWYVGLNQFNPRGSLPIEVIYSLDSRQTLNAYSITSGNDAKGRDPKVWRLYGSNNNSARQNPNHSSWTEISVETGVEFTGRGQNRLFTVTNPGSYQYYKLRVTELWGSTTEFQIADWTLEY